MRMSNDKRREINWKIVDVGPSVGGKTTDIRFSGQSVPAVSRGPWQSSNADGDRTLFFDYFALEIAEIQGFKTQFLIYGVPGQPYYKSTRKMVLNGVDGIVFIDDSDEYRMSDNLESLLDMKSMLKDYGYNYNEIPLVLQYNKRDLPSVTPANEMEQVLNDRQCDSFEAVAIQGRGVIETFKAICASVVERLNKTLSVKK